MHIALKRENILNQTMDVTGTEAKRQAAQTYIEKCIGELAHQNQDVIKQFWFEFIRRWERSQRKKDRFWRENEDWLEDCLIFERASSTRGRPVKEFFESGDRSKRQKTECARQSYTSGKSHYWFIIVLYCS